MADVTPIAPAVVEEPIVTRGTTVWKVALLLFVLSTLASVAIMPYTFTLMRQMPQYASLFQSSMFATPAGGLTLMVAITVFQVILETLIFAVAAGIGLWLGPRVGLGAPLLTAWLERAPDFGRRLRTMLLWSVGLGLLGGAFVIGVGYLTTPLMPKVNLTMPPWWEGLLASYGAGVREELWLRLGVMTLLVFLGTVPFKRRRPHVAVFWIANVLAGLAFASLHLPQASGLIGVTPVVVAFVLLANGAIGVLYGWLYSRYGILAAMIAHFSTDIVLHVLPVLFGL